MTFMCVSKSLYSTITSPDFINKHLHRAKLLSNDNNHNGYLLCKSKPKPVASSSMEDYLCTVVYNSDYTLTWICRFKIPFDKVHIVGFCNGIFCLVNYSDPIIYLWDPSIRKFKKILAPPVFKDVNRETHGFAYHSQNKDFKVLKIVSFIRRMLPTVGGVTNY